MNKRMKKMAWIAPAAIVGIALFIAIGGTVVMLLWNWLAPMLFGLPIITFWQAIGLLALGRILFGGFSRGGGCYRRCDTRGRIRERMDERWEKMSAEERERMRQGLYDRGETTPLDPNPSA